MAQKVTVQLVDDLDDSPITTGEGRTVEFGFDGSSYEIDLTNDNVDKFREAISDYIAAARKVSGRRTGGIRLRSRPRSAGTRKSSARSASGRRRTATRSRPVVVSRPRCRKRTQPHTDPLARTKDPGDRDHPGPSSFLPKADRPHLIPQTPPSAPSAAAGRAIVVAEATTWNKKVQGPPGRTLRNGRLGRFGEDRAVAGCKAGDSGSSNGTGGVPAARSTSSRGIPARSRSSR